VATDIAFSHLVGLWGHNLIPKTDRALA